MKAGTNFFGFMTLSAGLHWSNSKVSMFAQRCFLMLWVCRVVWTPSPFFDSLLFYGQLWSICMAFGCCCGTVVLCLTIAMAQLYKLVSLELNVPIALDDSSVIINRNMHYTKSIIFITQQTNFSEKLMRFIFQKNWVTIQFHTNFSK